MSECGGCGNDQAYPDEILNNLPQVVSQGSELSHLKYTLPPDDGVARRFGRPEFHNDGSIEYPVGKGDPPPDINGYRRDENNPWLFRPLWPPCVLRMQGSRLDLNSGAVQVTMLCNQPEAEHFMKRINAKNCVDCPVRKTE